MDSARMPGPALQMDRHEVGHERSAACLVSDGGTRREYCSCSLPAETRWEKTLWEEGCMEGGWREESLRRAAGGE